MNKLKYCMWRFKLWNRWRKETAIYSAWEKFLVLIGKKMSVSFYGLMMAESMMEGLREVEKAAKEASDSVKKLEQAIKDKLNIVSPSHIRHGDLDGHKIHTVICDEPLEPDQNSQPKS